MKKAVWLSGFVCTLFLLAYTTEAAAAHIHLETRGGAWTYNRSVKKDGAHGISQLYAEMLFPIVSVGKSIVETGPYLKFSYFDPGTQMALGEAFSYRRGKFAFLLHGGVAYADRKIGDAPLLALHESEKVWMGQTRWTWDLGAGLRWSFAKKRYVTLGYGHNSNGKKIHFDVFPGTGENPGMDYVYFGLGFRF